MSLTRENTMKGFVQNIEDITVKNEDFRRVLYTAKNCQLVLMALKPKEEREKPKLACTDAHDAGARGWT